MTTPRNSKPAPFGAGAGHAGASARREYDRRRVAREDQARQSFGFIGVAAARVMGEPQQMAAWRRGAEGEERVAASLERRLAGSGVALLHDRRLPGAGRANIDHIAVGPGGVTVIDAKNVVGRVRRERVGGLFTERRDVLRIDGRDRTRLVEGVARQVGAVADILRRNGHAAVDVRGALCFVDVNGLPLLRSLSVAGILVDGSPAAAALARREGTLSAADVDALWAILATALPAA